MNIYEDTNYADRWDAMQDEWERADDAIQARIQELAAAFEEVSDLSFCLNTLLLMLADTPRSPLSQAIVAYDVLFSRYVMQLHREELSVEDAMTLHNCAAMRTFNADWQCCPHLSEYAAVQLVIDATVKKCKEGYLAEEAR